MRYSFFGWLFIGMAALALTVRAEKSAEVYLFSYFTGNGEDGLHLAWSEDGYHWTKLGGERSYLTPEIGSKEKLMRDPSVVKGPDGVFHMVWTSGWHELGIGYASTRDFKTWSPQKEIPVMAQMPTARNSWAPEIIWDPARSHFLVLWASTIPEKFLETAGSSETSLNHRIYATTTTDWKTFTPTRLFLDPGYSVIDATILPANGSYHLIIKDETLNPPKKHLRAAVAADIEGPWGSYAEPFSPSWVEGPTAIPVGDAFLVYYDIYKEKKWGAARTRDFKSWEDVTGQVSVPKGARHGTMLLVPRPLVERLQSDAPQAK